MTTADDMLNIDTVDAATSTPGQSQPYAELGLKSDEYAKICDILKRRPTQSELAMYSVMWSEHCSYKSSKVHLALFSAKAPKSDRLLVGIGENAGVIDVGNDTALTFKIESHNHPSFVEPHQGAATGVGGIVRDILAMGARPVAVMDSLRFGAIDHPDTRRVLPGIVEGVGGYGNCLGLPNIGGEVVFDPCYQGNPLVNALCVGVMPKDRIQRSAATGVGNAVILLGAKTGRDGIGGVSVLASATFDDGDHSTNRPSVQVGDPFIEKLLIECCVELFDRQLIVGVQDLGGAGLTCATVETAAAGSSGMKVYLERVPLREASMLPHEILASESQERMLVIVTPDQVANVLEVAQRWGVLATDIGEVNDSGRLVISWNDQVVVDVPPGSLAHDGPVYSRPLQEPAGRDLVQADRAETLARAQSGEEIKSTLLSMISSANLSSRDWVTQQYDRYVMGNTVLAQPEDSGMIRIDEQSGRGIAVSVDGNGRYSWLDPYSGAQLALAEAYRNVAVSGATPVAVTNCLNFGSPEDPTVMWQFSQAVQGLADGCLKMGIPVTGGNVSFYNQTGTTPIHPTTVIGMVGMIDDVQRRIPMGFVAESDAQPVYVLGHTREELSGSEWARVMHDHLGGIPPVVDLDTEKKLGNVFAAAAVENLLASAHDVSEGGIAQALIESCLRHNVGVKIASEFELDLASYLFSESAHRAIAVPRAGFSERFLQLCRENSVPVEQIGIVSLASTSFTIDGLCEIALDELRNAHETTLAKIFG